MDAPHRNSFGHGVSSFSCPSRERVVPCPCPGELLVLLCWTRAWSRGALRKWVTAQRRRRRRRLPKAGWEQHKPFRAGPEEPRSDKPSCLVLGAGLVPPGRPQPGAGPWRGAAERLPHGPVCL